MSLKESLEKFKKRQAVCSDILKESAAKQSASRSSSSHRPNVSNTPPQRIHNPIAPPVRPPPTSVKFSSNTDRFQQINNIRKSTVGSQLKLVIALLFKTRASYTPEQINETCFVDVKGNKEVFESLKNNPKVHYDGKYFSYKATLDIHDKNGLLDSIRKEKEGIEVKDVKDAYPNVMEDLQALKAAGEIWLLSNCDSKDDVAYPVDRKININVDGDLKELFRRVELPRDMLDIEKGLKENGMKPATNTAQRRAAAQVGIIVRSSKSKKKKKHEITKRTKLTNYHLPELFQHLKK